VRFRIVLFDLDGTLIDSGPIILASMQHAVTTVLGREIPVEELGMHIGGQGIVAQMQAIDAARADDLLEAYKTHNDGLHETLEAFPGIGDVLAQLREEGRRLGVVTAKRRATVEIAFAKLPLGHLFDTVVGGDETERHKPDPQPLLLGLERLGERPERAAYVGDSPYDMQAANAAGLYAVGVTWGAIHDRGRLADADVVVDNPGELLDVL
jgi:pyrophosphatase PpaX